MIPRLLILASLALGLISFDASAQRRPANANAPKAAPAAIAPVVYTGATVHTGAGAILSDVTVVVAGGKIQAIGKSALAPPGAETLSARGMIITPGLVDALTSVGLVEVDLEESTRDDHRSGSDLIRAGFRAADGYNPASTVIGVTRAEGVTSVGVMPTGGLVSGLSAWADLDGAVASEAIAAAPLALHVHLGARAAGGHATAILRAREAFDDARSFQKNRAAYERNQARRFAPSRLDLEALTLALGGKVPVVFHVDRAADILSALALAADFELRPVIAGGAEAWKVARALSAAKVPVILNPLAQPGSFDAVGAREDAAARLFAAGVPVAISTFDTHNARKLRQLAGNAVRSGLPHEAALAAITRVPAEALGLGARYGTLAPGKVANLVVWSGDPLEISSRVMDVMIRGKRVSLRNRQTALFDRYKTIPR